MAVYEETGKLIGQRVLPLDGLQAGYRHISLRTEGNFPLSLPTLFCEIILKSYVPDGWSAFVDQLNKPLSQRKAEEALAASLNNASDAGAASSGSSIRRCRGLADPASGSSPSLDSRVTTGTSASGGSEPTGSTTDTTSVASGMSVKLKSPAEAMIPITLAYLREQKSFCKLKHKQEKDLALVKKRQAKEQNLLGEQQSKAMGKVKIDHVKPARSPMIQIGNQRKDLG